MEIKPWIRSTRELLADCRIFQIHQQEAKSPLSGKLGNFFLLETMNWVNVVPVTEENELVLVRQYRHGTDAITIEIPGGAIDQKDGGDALVAAKRELLEETGHEAPEWISLGINHPNPAIQGNICHTFLARGAKKVAPLKLDALEEIEVVKVPVSQIADLVKKGKITHSLVLTAFYFFDRYLDQPVQSELDDK